AALGLVVLAAGGMYLAGRTSAEFVGTGGEFLSRVGQTVEVVGAGFGQALDEAIFRPALEVLLMADPDNMEHDPIVPDDVVGAITNIGWVVQRKILSAGGAAEAVESALLPISNFASAEDMELIAAVGREIGIVSDEALNPSVLLMLKPAAFFRR